MIELLIIVGAACLAIVFVDVSGIPLWIKKQLWGVNAFRYRLKPLDCTPCLAFWLGGFFSIFFHKNLLLVPCIGAMSCILAIWITKKLNT